VNILQGFFDIVWPRRCEICGRSVDRPRRFFCTECVNRIPFISPGDTAYDIPDAVSAVRFEGETREAVNAYKFRAHLWLKEDFTDWLEAAVSARFNMPSVDAVIPVPVSIYRRWDRGYNQCEYLARSLARRMDRACLRGVLRRVGNPRRQSELSGEERSENIKGTFAVARPELVRGRTLLLVDDIMTTGSTLAEASDTLKQAGASVVWSASLARSNR
jgi:ComF family protein